MIPQLFHNRTPYLMQNIARGVITEGPSPDHIHGLRYAFTTAPWRASSCPHGAASAGLRRPSSLERVGHSPREPLGLQLF